MLIAQQILSQICLPLSRYVCLKLMALCVLCCCVFPCSVCRGEQTAWEKKEKRVTVTFRVQEHSKNPHKAGVGGRRKSE